MRWFEQPHIKNSIHWVTNPRSGASWPEIFPDLEIPKSTITKKHKAKRKSRNIMAKLSRRKNR